MSKRTLGALAALAGALAIGGAVAVNETLLATSGCVPDATSAATVPPGGSWNAAYQSAAPGSTITVSPGTYPAQSILRRADMAGRPESDCISFLTSGNVTINGSLSVEGSGVLIRGQKVNGVYTLDVKGQVNTITESFTTHPDSITIETLKAVTFGVYSSEKVTFADMDIGPATISKASGSCQVVEAIGGTDENKINGRGRYVPKDIVLDGLVIHNQNGRNPDRADCHWGGLFIVNADGFTMRNTTMYDNVVYNVQIQNFVGPAPKNLRFEGNAFGCPVQWLDRGRICTQRSIQLSTSDQGVENIVITGNNSSNGPNGIFGCFVPGCAIGAVSLSNNLETAPNPNPPPLPDEPPSTTTTTTEPPPQGFALRLVSQTPTKITLGWDPVTGAVGYRFQSAANAPKWSHTFDPTRTSVVFAQGKEPYVVQALGVLDEDVYP